MTTIEDKGSIYKDGTYLSHHPTWHAEDSARKAVQISKALDRIMPVSSICDIGCGAGQILRCLQAQRPGVFQELVGYDISPQAIEIARSNPADNIRFELGDPPPDRVFDVALAIDVFEHVDDYIGFLRKLRGLAKYKILHIPLDLTVGAAVRPGRIRHLRSQLGHIHYFNKTSALGTLELCGYEIVSYFYTQVMFDGLSWTLRRLPQKAVQLFSQDAAVCLFGGYSLMVTAK